MTKTTFYLIITLLVATSTTFAQTSTEKKENIFSALSETDSVTNAKVKFHQDKRIEQLVNYKKTNIIPETTGGYRVQVFSSNAQRTAKAEAFRIEKMIKDQFPDQGVYVNYVSPFWKVRVGDFKTQQEAQAFRSEVMSAFPELKSETYTVKDQINI